MLSGRRHSHNLTSQHWSLAHPPNRDNIVYLKTLSIDLEVSPSLWKCAELFLKKLKNENKQTKDTVLLVPKKEKPFFKLC